MQYQVIDHTGRSWMAPDLNTLRLWVTQGRIGPNTQIIDPVTGTPRCAQDLVEIQDMFPSPSNPYAAGYSTAQYPRPGTGYQTGANIYTNSFNPLQPYVSQKSKVTAIVLAFFLGSFGIHRFYLGHTGTGLAMLLIGVIGIFACGVGPIITGIWAFIDLILISTDALRDANGGKLS